MHYIVETMSIAVKGLGGKARRDKMDQVKLNTLYMLCSRNYEHSSKGAKWKDKT
jgi:hypothetical protein